MRPVKKRNSTPGTLLSLSVMHRSGPMCGRATLLRDPCLGFRRVRRLSLLFGLGMEMRCP